MEGGWYDELGFYNLPEGGFYDPDGYLFNKEGYDEFGGYYDERGFYHPGEKNKHEFEQYAADYEDDEDDLIRQYEMGHADEDEDYYDNTQEQLYRQFLKEKKEIEQEEDEAGEEVEEVK